MCYLCYVQNDKLNYLSMLFQKYDIELDNDYVKTNLSMTNVTHWIHNQGYYNNWEKFQHSLSKWSINIVCTFNKV